jgi:5'-methylthioadenosine phosphorylase
MTNLTEAKLAREAEMSFATLAMVTDYDCWRESHDAVTVEQVVATATDNVQKAKNVVRAFVPLIAAHEGDAPQSTAMHGACMTAVGMLPASRVKALRPLIGAYMQE